MITLEIEKFAPFAPENVFRISIVSDDLEILSHEDLRPYTNLRSLLLENNQNLKTLDLRGNTSLKYLCLGTCDHLAVINLDKTAIENLDLYDLVGLETVQLDDSQLLNLTTILTDNITKQFLYIEDAILEGFEKRIESMDEGPHKKALKEAYESYLDS